METNKIKNADLSADIDLVLEKIKEVLSKELIHIIDSKKPSNDPYPLKDHLSRKEAARFLGVSIPTLYRYESFGRIIRSCQKPIRYKKSDLLEYLESENKF